MRRAVLTAACVTVLGSAAGCGSAAGHAADANFSCENITVPGHTLTDGRLATELSAAGRRTVLQTQGVTAANLKSWRIVEDSAARVTIIRPLARPETENGHIVASHQYVDLKPYGPRQHRPEWIVAIPSTCALREVTPVTAAGPSRAAPRGGA